LNVESRDNMDMNFESLSPRYYVKQMLAESEEPDWYHVNE